MYLVTVLLADNGEAVDYADFEIGSWKEIGYWLDHHGYIDEKYMLRVRFAG